MTIEPGDVVRVTGRPKKRYLVKSVEGAVVDAYLLEDGRRPAGSYLLAVDACRVDAKATKAYREWREAS